MVTSEERMRILRMIDEGKLTAEEGSRLLAALADSRKNAGRTVVAGTRSAPPRGWLRVRVTDMATGRAKVNVNLPLALLDAGMNIATQFAPNIDFAEIAEAVRQGQMEGKIVDVMDEVDGEHVEIFID